MDKVDIPCMMDGIWESGIFGKFLTMSVCFFWGGRRRLPWNEGRFLPWILVFIRDKVVGMNVAFRKGHYSPTECTHFMHPTYIGTNFSRQDHVQIRDFPIQYSKHFVGCLSPLHFVNPQKKVRPKTEVDDNRFFLQDFCNVVDWFREKLEVASLPLCQWQSVCVFFSNLPRPSGQFRNSDAWWWSQVSTNNSPRQKHFLSETLRRMTLGCGAI